MRVADGFVNVNNEAGQISGIGLISKTVMPKRQRKRWVRSVVVIVKLWRRNIPEPFWHCVDLIQDLFVQQEVGNEKAKQTVRTLRAANERMEKMAGTNTHLFLKAEAMFEVAIKWAGRQGYIVKE